MTDTAVYPIPDHFSEAHVTPERYDRLYRQSLEDPETFWSEQAQILDWHSPWTAISDTDVAKGAARWFVDAKLNVSVNCIDRHCQSAQMTPRSSGKEMTPMTASRSPIKNSRFRSVDSLMC